VFSNPVENADDGFNEWYDQTHGPDVLALGVAVSFTRYKSSGVPVLPGLPEPARYAAIYEVEAETREQIEAAAATLQAGIASGAADVSPLMDPTSVQAAWLLPITERVTSDSRATR
jgi:hypothetical protein